MIEDGQTLSAIEIKSVKTLSIDFFSGLKYWNQISNTTASHNFLVYGGDTVQKRSDAKVIPWNQLNLI